MVKQKSKRVAADAAYANSMFASTESILYVYEQRAIQQALPDKKQ